MLHLLYILAFTVLACIAVANLIRNLIMFSFDRELPNNRKGNFGYHSSGRQSVPHPELLDNMGKVIKEPLLIMRSINVEDARQQLDAIYDSSPSNRAETEGL